MFDCPVRASFTAEMFFNSCCSRDTTISLDSFACSWKLDCILLSNVCMLLSTVAVSWTRELWIDSLNPLKSSLCCDSLASRLDILVDTSPVYRIRRLLFVRIFSQKMKNLPDRRDLCSVRSSSDISCCKCTILFEMLRCTEFDNSDTACAKVASLIFEDLNR